MLEYLSYALLGVAAGLFTGMVPGIHTNTLSTLALGIYFSGFSGEALAFFLVAAAAANSFAEFLPAIFIGAPDPDVSASVLPAHRLFLLGRGYEALLLAVAGGLIGTAALAAALPVLFVSLPFAYPIIKANMPWLLGGLAIIMIAMERKLLAGGAVFALAALFGLISSALPLNRNYALLPLLSGLFGLSGLLLSNRLAEPKQLRVSETDSRACFSGGLLGLLGGIVAGILPGFGGAQAAVLVQELAKIRDGRTFLVTQGAISATNTTLSILALYLIGNPRSGAAVAVGQMLQFSFWDAMSLFGVALLSSGVAAFAVLSFGKRMSKIFSGANSRFTGLPFAAATLIAIFYFTGPLGIMIAAVGTAIGVMPQLLGVKKSLCMACLIVPTILYLAGLDQAAATAIGLG